MDEAQTSNGGSQPSDGIAAVVSDVGNQVQQILDAAENAARQIEAEARKAAEEYLRQRRGEADRLYEEQLAALARTTGSLKSRIENTHHETAALVAELDMVISKLVRVPTDEQRPTPTEAGQASAERAPLEAVSYPGNGGSGTQISEDIPQGALLRATQMAVAGTERAEIERMLRNEFGIQDPVSVVDRMLRAESS